VAKRGLVAYVADCSNAFAEAPPPKHPLFMHIDEAYHDWWVNHLGKPPIPPDKTVVGVQNAIQGHPESPRLWEKMIDCILRDIGLQPTKHEPCLYKGIYQGKYTMFMRQADDFAIATDCNDTATALINDTATALINDINQHLCLPIHILGEVTHYNGMDIEQTKHYVKIHCKKYITKLHQNYPWLEQEQKPSGLPLPFPSDSTFLSKLIHNATETLTNTKQNELEIKMGIKFRQAMGK
jgi:hypothetical protein